MALGTVTLVKKTVFGDLNVWIVDVVPSSGANYTTNGEAFDVAQIPGASGSIIHVAETPAVVQGANATVTVWNPTTKKLMAFGTAGSATGLTEIANNTDLSGKTARLLVFTK